MKKLSYKKPLVEVMDFDATDILTGSTDGAATISFADGAETSAYSYLSIGEDGTMSVQ